MSRLLLACGAATVLAALAGCVSTPAEDDPVQVKLNDLETRTARIERVVSNNSLLEMAQRMDAQTEEIRKLRGRIDELENANEALRKQQRDLYADLDKRLNQLGAGGAGAAGAALGAGSSGDTQAGDRAAYAQALDVLKSGKYPEAIASLKQFLVTYPKSSLADNAQYWLGEAYYVTRDFPNAASAFRSVVDTWPDSRKAPDAMLKLGYAQSELKQYADARASLTSVQKRYPDSDAAKLAATRLRTLPNEAGTAATDSHDSR